MFDVLQSFFEILPCHVFNFDELMFILNSLAFGNYLLKLEFRKEFTEQTNVKISFFVEQLCDIF